VPFVPCCDANGDVTPEGLAAAVAAAREARVAIVCAGLPDVYESEGFDREGMGMPAGHNRMIEAVVEANPNTVVVLLTGSPVEMPWWDRVPAVLYMGLPGQEGGRAAGDLLTGLANPSGKLAESWPMTYDDVACRETFGQKVTHYREGVYVGYRHYDKAGIEPRLPFGHGLSYTSFEYRDMRIEPVAEGYTVSASVCNTGNVSGREVVQLYVGAPGDPEHRGVHRPVKELKGFTKVELAPGEQARVSFELDRRSFALWQDGWRVPGGTYTIMLAASSRDIRLSQTLDIAGEPLPAPAWQAGSWYETMRGLPTAQDFEAALGAPPIRDKPIRKGAFSSENTLIEMEAHSLALRMVHWNVDRVIIKKLGGTAHPGDPTFKMMAMTAVDCPLYSAISNSNGQMPEPVAYALVDIANGHYLKALRKLLTWKAE
jgi:beta-glucosidase